MDAPQPLQRAQGAVRIAAKRRGDATVLDRLYQSGSGKARIPRGPGFEAVLLNTAGGVTGGDVFTNAVTAGAGTAVTVTTQTAERIYRSTGENGRIENHLVVEKGARLDWLPQETILFDGGRIARRLSVDMAEDASLLAIEPLVLGRAAMGEQVERGFAGDQWRVRRGGRLVYADAFRLEDRVPECGAGRSDASLVRDDPAPRGIGKIIARNAALNGGTCCASLLYVAPDAEDRIAPVRDALAEAGGASAWDGLLAARIVAANGSSLRQALIRVVSVLRAGPLPRVWFT